jgi:hypothetical protein
MQTTSPRPKRKIKDALTCRREQPTGSNVSERICLTAEVREKIEQQSQEMLDRPTRKAQPHNDQQLVRFHAPGTFPLESSYA